MKKDVDKKKDEVAVTRAEQVARATVAPLLRFRETEDGFELRLNLPGIDKKNLQVQVADQTLSIEAHREETPREGTCIRQEFPVVNYRAAYALPDDVDPDAVSAKLTNGILTVTLKKREAAKPRSIKVSIG